MGYHADFDHCLCVRSSLVSEVNGDVASRDESNLTVIGDRFERAWQQKFGPEIDSFLPSRSEADAAFRRALLSEG